jgi:hypothetical protein
LKNINIFKSKNGIKYLTFKPLNDLGLINFFSTRLGGISKKSFDSLNLAFHNGDEFENVLYNRNLFFNLNGIKLENAVASIQTHSTNVKIVDKSMRGMGTKTLENAISDNDGMITNCTNTFLTAFYADCVPIYIYDKFNKVISLLHAGWKGTLGKISWSALNKMNSIYNTRPLDCTAVIGPSIGPCCYEIDEDVVFKFKEKAFNLTKIISCKNDHYLLNLWEANKQTLLEYGIPDNNIFISKLCTCCNNDIFFSYRGENGSTGRMAAILALRDGN